jgi:cell wall-associated NlpC family hydrolase
MNELDPALWSDLIGKPFVNRARGPDAYDCFGILLEIYRRRGILILDSDYNSSPTNRRVELTRRLTDWHDCPVAPGVALVFRERGIPGHVGIAIDEDRFIHSSEQVGQVAIGLLSRGWKPLLIGAFIHKSELT